MATEDGNRKTGTLRARETKLGLHASNTILENLIVTHIVEGVFAELEGSYRTQKSTPETHKSGPLPHTLYLWTSKAEDKSVPQSEHNLPLRRSTGKRCLQWDSYKTHKNKTHSYWQLQQVADVVPTGV